jgi:catechol 2,3-dioxygenase-like lactoylglutathione lyase family enzyme
MLAFCGIYEWPSMAKDLATSEIFYREILGLEIGLTDERRKWLFLRPGEEAW